MRSSKRLLYSLIRAAVRRLSSLTGLNDASKTGCCEAWRTRWSLRDTALSSKLATFSRDRPNYPTRANTVAETVCTRCGTAVQRLELRRENALHCPVCG